MKLIIDKASKLPIYKQMALQFEDAIKNGIFKENDKLPTEKELLQSNRVAKGTIKRAYSELEDMKYVKKIQGSGTYVLGSAEYNPIKKGETIVHDTISKLSPVSSKEIYTLFSSELSTRFKHKSIVNMAWIDCSPEVLRITEKQILEIPNLKITQFLIDDIIANRALLDNSYDLITTTQAHYADLLKLISSEYLRIEKLGLSVSNSTVAEIAKIPDDKAIVVIYESDHFLENIIDKLKMLDKGNNIMAYRYDCDIDKLKSEVLDVGAFLVPPDYPISLDANIANLINSFVEKNYKVIPFEYLIDRGSLFHLELKIEEFYEKKYGKREM